MTFMEKSMWVEITVYIYLTVLETKEVSATGKDISPYCKHPFYFIDGVSSVLMLLVSCGLHTCTIRVLLRRSPMPVSSSTAPTLSCIKFRISVSISKVYSSTCNYHYYLSSLKCVILASAPIWEAVEAQTFVCIPGSFLLFSVSNFMSFIFIFIFCSISWNQW